MEFARLVGTISNIEALPEICAAFTAHLVIDIGSTQ
jgi:hypothetical protein